MGAGWDRRHQPYYKHMTWYLGGWGDRDKEACTSTELQLLRGESRADHPKVLHMCSRAEQASGCKAGGGSLGLAVREATASGPGEAVSPSWGGRGGMPPNLRWCELMLSPVFTQRTK